jgi:cytochrome c-type biogenesis protein CcmH/NrfF
MAVFLVFAHGAYAASSENAEEQARRAAEIYKTTMSPFCPGRTVDACPSPNATAWREDIRRWVAEGVSTEEIRRRLKERSDQDLSGAPSTSLDAVLPIGATVVSLILLGLLLRLLVRPANSTPSPDRETFTTKEEGKTPTHDKVSEQELEDRLERELEQLDD